MATLAQPDRRRPVKPLAADGFERALALGAIVLLAAAVLAIGRGWRHWGEVPAAVWLHLATILLATALTPLLLLRRRGDRRHRVLGTWWVGAMIVTAATSFLIRQTAHGGFSAIHILSVFVLAVAPLIWWTARTGRVTQHRSAVRGTVFGALLIAGFFTFPFGRMLGAWLFA